MSQRYCLIFNWIKGRSECQVTELFRLVLVQFGISHFLMLELWIWNSPLTERVWEKSSKTERFGRVIHWWHTESMTSPNFLEKAILQNFSTYKKIPLYAVKYLFQSNMHIVKKKRTGVEHECFKSSGKLKSLANDSRQGHGNSVHQVSSR